MTASLSDLKGKHILVMGLGLFGDGVGVVRYLHREGARVTVTDLRDADALSESVKALDDLPVEYKLGGHDEADFTSVDLVVANPAVPRSSPFLAVAEAAGVPVTTEICLFVAHCQASIVGVTGTSGKTTTVSLIGEMLRRIAPQTLVGGNIGVSLLNRLGDIGPYTPVVLELSSFQLDRLQDLSWSPAIAVVTNFAPNHVDVHGSLEAYETAKRGILSFQKPLDTAVLNADDAKVWSWGGRSAAMIRPFSIGRRVEGGVYVEGDTLFNDLLGDAKPLCPVSDVSLQGRHNLANAAAALCAAMGKGVPDTFAVDVLKTFRGVEHRLERVEDVGSYTFYNDSIATSPDRTLVALHALEERPVLIAGGYDKGLGFDKLGRAIAERTAGLVVFGQTAEAIALSVPA